MTKVIHIVGQQGTGKSTLAQAIAVFERNRNRSCLELVGSGLQEPGVRCDINGYRHHGVKLPHLPKPIVFDLLIAEHLDDPEPSQVRAGDLLIRVERAA